jgi:hypothetical protein
METLGIIFLVLIGAAVIVVAVLFLASLPDLSRYLRVRRM